MPPREGCIAAGRIVTQRYSGDHAAAPAVDHTLSFAVQADEWHLMVSAPVERLSPGRNEGGIWVSTAMTINWVLESGLLMGSTGGHQWNALCFALKSFLPACHFPTGGIHN